MHLWDVFRQWLRRSSDKAEKIEQKNDAEAEDFARRLYEQSGSPNEKLREVYANGRAARGLPAKGHVHAG